MKEIAFFVWCFNILTSIVLMWSLIKRRKRYEKIEKEYIKDSVELKEVYSTALKELYDTLDLYVKSYDSKGPQKSFVIEITPEVEKSFKNLRMQQDNLYKFLVQLELSEFSFLKEEPKKNGRVLL